MTFKRNIFIFVVMLISCAPRHAVIDHTAEGNIFWPGNPEKPRISYLWSIAAELTESVQPKDFFLQDSLFSLPSLPEMIRPYNIYVDEEEILYATDQGTRNVYAVDLKSGELRILIDAVSTGLIAPLGIGACGNLLYVSDPFLQKVLIIDREGRKAGEFQGEFKRPTSLSVDKGKGIIYVTDTLAHTIYRYDLRGNRLGSIGSHGTGEGEFNFPSHLWVDKDGRLYVTDAMNFRIQVFSPEGEFERMFGVLGDAYGELDKPKGVATDSEGNVYVVDSIKDTVKIFNREGKLLLFFGEQGKGFGQFYLPSGIFIDKKDQIYVADTYNGRVQVFRYMGVK